MTSTQLLHILGSLGEGMLTTVEIFVLTLVMSLPLGFLFCFARMSKSKVISTIMKVYIAIMRGTPLMLQLMVVFFGPNLLFGIRLSWQGWRFTAVIVGFVLNYAAYFAEIFRAGMESIPVGQYEAANILGFSKSQTFFKIVLPQVVKRVLPPVTNETITLVKDTSLAFVLSVTEMFTEAKMIVASTSSMLPYIAAAVFYFVFNAVVAAVMGAIEKKLNYYN